MKTRMITALVLAAAASFVSLASSASAWEAWKPTFRSEQEIVTYEGDKEISYLREHYGAKPGFTAQEYGEAVAEQEIQRLRRDYNLGTNFTSDDLAANYGAREVAYLMKHYKLPSHFTSDQLKAAKIKADASFAVEGHPGLSYPFSYADYVRVRGAEEAAWRATEFRLPTVWVYADLVAAAGPRRAAEIRSNAGFAKDATHAEIEQALGVNSGNWYAKDHGLPIGFTADDLLTVRTPGYWQYSDYAKLPANFTDADLVAFYGQRKVADYAEHMGLPAQFTEADIRKAAAARAIESMQKRFDLDANFTEADVRRAAGLSDAAETRHTYKLRPDFTASEYEAAFKKTQQHCGRDGYFTYDTGCGTY